MFETRFDQRLASEVDLQNRQAKLDIEHSRTYIGYKLLWVTSLFIEGKKFPSGTLSSFKWRCYIYDIVRFLTNEKFISYFLTFDPASFFAVVAKLFLEPVPFEYIKSQTSFIEMYKDTVVGLESCPTHAEIIACLDQNVTQLLQDDKLDSGEDTLSEKGEALLNSFIFFIAKVGTQRSISIEKDLCVRTLSELITFHRKLVELPKD